MRVIMSADENGQLDLGLDEENNDVLVFEDTTLNADRVLAKAVGKFEHVFLLGVDREGITYYSDHHDGMFWLLALERARDFLKRNMH